MPCQVYHRVPKMKTKFLILSQDLLLSSILGNFYSSVMPEKRKEFLLYMFFVICYASSFPTEVCICSGKQGCLKLVSAKNTVYRFLNSTKTNWLRFTTLLSERIINGFMKPLTSDERKGVFIIDDSLFDRSRSAQTELLAKVFDHCPMKYKRGYRMLTLGWSDGNSFIPVNHRLLSAADDKNLLCEAVNHDGRSLAGKRRRQSRRKATEVMVELIKLAQQSGLTAKLYMEIIRGSPAHSYKS